MSEHPKRNMAANAATKEARKREREARQAAGGWRTLPAENREEAPEPEPEVVEDLEPEVDED